MTEFINIAISRSDGGVSVMMFITREYNGPKESPLSFSQGATDENINAAILKGNLDCVSWVRIDAPPKDRTFRAAWKMEGKDIVEDPAKSKEIFIERLRIERSQKFEQLDKEFIIAQQKKEDTTEIEEKSQHLRDLPDTVSEQIKDLSVEDLKSFEIPWQKVK